MKKPADFVYRHYDGAKVLLVPKTLDAHIWALVYVRVEFWQNKDRIVIESSIFNELSKEMQAAGLELLEVN